MYGNNFPVISNDNSTIVALNPTSSWTGSFEDVSSYPSVTFSLKANTSGSLFIDFSPDAVNVDSTLTYQYAANFNEIHRLGVTRKYYRARIYNASTSSQVYLRFQTTLGDQTVLSAPLNLSIQQDADAIMVRNRSEEIDIAAGLYNGYEIINKFGRNPDVDGAADIWGGSSTYSGFPTGSAEKLSIFSSDASDTSAGLGARTIRIFGLNNDYYPQTEDISLNGTSPVTSSLFYRRMHRAYALTSGNNDTNIGSITIRHNTTTANVFAILPSGSGQTEVAAYTIPRGYTGYLKSYHASLLDTNDNSATLVLWTRPSGSAVRIRQYFSINRSARAYVTIYGGIELEEMTDLKIRCIEVANNNARITATFDILLINNF